MRKTFIAVIVLLLLSVRLANAAVDINTATAEEFDRLKGIGPVKAKAIVDYRTKNGPFKSIGDIKKVPGISDATFQTIKPDITIAPSHVKKSGDEKRAMDATPKGSPSEKDAKAR
ncbi:MAG: helix-hairpin-helix domain-containing protein [Betaproteobacteria bacterium]|nr:helix-hairpin-helix domain-containing protein [Betaproteobacteria bacterium]